MTQVEFWWWGGGGYHIVITYTLLRQLNLESNYYRYFLSKHVISYHFICRVKSGKSDCFIISYNFLLRVSTIKEENVFLCSQQWNVYVSIQGKLLVVYCLLAEGKEKSNKTSMNLAFNVKQHTNKITAPGRAENLICSFDQRLAWNDSRVKPVVIKQDMICETCVHPCFFHFVHQAILDKQNYNATQKLDIQ